MKKADHKSNATTRQESTPFFGKGGDLSSDHSGNSSAFFAPAANAALQTQLTIGQPADKYELEAEETADKVVQRLSGSNIAADPPDIMSLSEGIQKACAECEREEKVQKKEKDDEEEMNGEPVQRKPIFDSDNIPPPEEEQVQRKCAECEEEEKVQAKSNSEPGAATPQIESQLASSKGSGQPLPESSLNRMQHSFGTDFSNVRIHTGSSAVQMSRDLNAQAFTHGSDIYFNSGKYNTESTSGQHLLAHELTHVVQQTGPGQIQRQVDAGAPIAGVEGNQPDTASQSVAAPDGTQAVPNPTGTVITTPIPPLLTSLIEWQLAGLLDPPFRPGDVAPIPNFPITQEQGHALMSGGVTMIMGGLVARSAIAEGATSTATGAAGTAIERAALRWGTAAVIEGGGAAATVAETTALARLGLAVRGAAGPVSAGLLILLWPSPTAPAWMDTLSPITGGPYSSPDEYDWTWRLSPEQRDYLRYLERAKRIQPDPSIDDEPESDAPPVPAPRPDPGEDERNRCVSRDVSRRGGNPRHDAYATRVTRTIYDYYVWPGVPFLGINYDGRSDGVLVWEVKVGHGWFFNPAMASLRDRKLALFDAQAALGVGVAMRCRYIHLWSIPDRYVASLLNFRWGGMPPVLSIPEF